MLLEVVADRCANTSAHTTLSPSPNAVSLELDPTTAVLSLGRQLLEKHSRSLPARGRFGEPLPEALASPLVTRQLAALLSLLEANLRALECGDAIKLTEPADGATTLYDELVLLSRALRALSTNPRTPLELRAQAVNTLLAGAATLHPTAEARAELVHELMRLSRPAETLLGLARCSLFCVAFARDASSVDIVRRMLRNTAPATAPPEPGALVGSADDVDPAFRGSDDEARAARRAVALLLHVLFTHMETPPLTKTDSSVDAADAPASASSGDLSRVTASLAAETTTKLTNYAIEVALAMLGTGTTSDSITVALDEPLLQLVLPAALKSLPLWPATAEGAAAVGGEKDSARSSSALAKEQLRLLIRLQRRLAEWTPQEGAPSTAGEPVLEQVCVKELPSRRLGHDPAEKATVDGWTNFNVVLPSPATTFSEAGEVRRWHWFARNNQTVCFQVWRPTGRETVGDNKFTLVGSTSVTVAGGYGSKQLAISERIVVAKGDVLGIRLASPATIPFTLGCGHRAWWPSRANHPAPVVGQDYTFENCGSGGNHDREYAISCDWVPGAGALAASPSAAPTWIDEPGAPPIEKTRLISWCATGPAWDESPYYNMDLPEVSWPAAAAHSTLRTTSMHLSRAPSPDCFAQFTALTTAQARSYRVRINSRFGYDDSVEAPTFVGGCLSFTRDHGEAPVFDALSSARPGVLELVPCDGTSESRQKAFSKMFGHTNRYLLPRQFDITGSGPGWTGFRIRWQMVAAMDKKLLADRHASFGFSVTAQLPIRRPVDHLATAQQLGLALSSAISERLLLTLEAASALDETSAASEAQIADVHALIGTLAGGASKRSASLQL